MLITYSVSMCIFLQLNIQERLNFVRKAAKPGKTVVLRRTEFLFVTYVQVLAGCCQKPLLPGKHCYLMPFQILLWVLKPHPPFSWPQAAVHRAVVSHLGFKVYWVEAGAPTCLYFRSVSVMWAYHPCEPNYYPCLCYAVSSILQCGLLLFWAPVALKAFFLSS